MQSEKAQKTGLAIWIGVAAIAALLGLAAGLGLASTLLDPGGSKLTAKQLSQAQADVQSLQADLDEGQSTAKALEEELSQVIKSNEALSTQLPSLLAELAQKTGELEDLSSQLDAVSTSEEQIAGLQVQISDLSSQLSQNSGKLSTLESMTGLIENNRLLLVEIRRDPPLEREEAFTYWRNVRSLAAKADPSLASPVDRVILSIDNYFDWNDRAATVASADDQLNWLNDYDTSGARAYDEQINTFVKDALLSVITRLDVVKAQLQ